MKCATCGKDKPRSAFSQRKDAKRGYNYNCKPCVSQHTARWQKANPESRAATRRSYKHRNYVKLMVKRAKRRAAKSGVSFTLTERDLKRLENRVSSGTCELTGIKFNLDGFSYRTPSLDRIDAARGYEYGNVRVILYGLNAAFGSWGSEVLLKMVMEYLGRKRNAKSKAS